MRGLGQITDVLSQALFPVAQEATAGLDPRTVKAMQRQSLMQLGLGMMAAKGQGAGLGQGLNFAFNQAQQDMHQGLGQALLSRRAQREDERLDLQTRMAQNNELQQDQNYLQSRIDRERDRMQWKQQFDANQANVATDNARQQAQFDASRRDQAAQFATQNRRLEDADRKQTEAEERNRMRFTSSMRKEFHDRPQVQAYEAALPVLQSAKNSPDTGAGDLDMIYSVGKILDPGSVVREGEMILVKDANSPIAKILGTTRFVLGKGGRLPPEYRQQLIAMLEQRVGSYQQGYDQERTAYGRYAGEQGLDSDQVIGPHVLDAYGVGGNVSGPGRAPAGLSDGARKYLSQ